MNDVGTLTRLLPLACIFAAVALFASELMAMFEFIPPGGEALCDQGAGDRHSNAQMVLAGCAVIATVFAVYGGSRPAAISVAVFGMLALLIFLISDLRVVNATGSLSESCGAAGQVFPDAEAVPQGGFWLELVGALALAVTGIALATLTPEQLAGLRPPRRARPTEPRGHHSADGDPDPTDAHDAPATAPAERPKRRLPSLRPRSRG